MNTLHTFIVTHRFPHPTLNRIVFQEHRIDGVYDIWGAAQKFSKIVQGGDIVGVRIEDQDMPDGWAELETAMELLTDMDDFWDCGTPVHPFSDLASKGKAMLTRYALLRLMLAHNEPLPPRDLYVIVDGGSVAEVHDVPKGVRVITREYGLSASEMEDKDADKIFTEPLTKRQAIQHVWEAAE